MLGISELATRALKEAKMDKQRGKSIFFDLLNQYPEVEVEFQARAVDSAASQLMSLAAHRTRTPIRTQAMAATGTDGGGIVSMSMTYKESMLEGWALACNKALGKGTLEDLMLEVQVCEKGAHGLMVKARFYQAVAKGKGMKLPGALVEDCWTDARLRFLFQRLGG